MGGRPIPGLLGVQGCKSPSITPGSGPPTTPGPSTGEEIEGQQDAHFTQEKIRYQFYEKEISASVSLLETSAASTQGKMSTLTQEVKRRLINTQEDLMDEKIEILNTFGKKLRRSGYSNK